MNIKYIFYPLINVPTNIKHKCIQNFEIIAINFVKKNIEKIYANMQYRNSPQTKVSLAKKDHVMFCKN